MEKLSAPHLRVAPSLLGRLWLQVLAAIELASGSVHREAAILGVSTTYGTSVPEKSWRIPGLAKGGAWSPTTTNTVGLADGPRRSCWTDW